MIKGLPVPERSCFICHFIWN